MAGSGSPPRHAPLLRRQTSNLPGQVHHMAVMVAPSRVDYSVNKGGLRSWAVIIVFVLLCSAILNIFSEEGEGRYREEDFDEEKEQQKQVHRRRVKSWRALQTAKSLAEGMRPRKELLKKKHKLHDFVSALEKYQKVLIIDRSSPRLSALYYVQCARFRGGSQQLHKILQVQRAMILEINPHHSQAQAYFGYILKVYEGDLERGVQLMRRALRANKEGNVVNDQKFYFHLGDALTRLGRLKDAHSVYADAVKFGLFPSILQRSFHNLAKLTARSWWTIEQTECSRQLRQLERHWTTVKENDGHWILTIKDKGNSISEEICGENLMPLTCQMLREGFTDAAPANALRIALIFELWHPEVPHVLRGKIDQVEDN
uniref:Aspartyl/asparaginyl beta-hydroxylase n=1 Tax=Meloidogyne javanica TaxID=6303 RepID=A0A915LQM2_MELJA